jgi:signal peptidase I
VVIEARPCLTATQLDSASPAPKKRATGAGRADRIVAKDETAGGAITETIKTIVYALLIAGVFRTLFFQPFWIPSGSMKDTLLIGDFLFVNKMAYGYSRYSCPFGLCPISGPHPRRRTRTRRCRGLPPPGHRRRLHQARDRHAGGPHPDARRHSPHQRRGRAAGTRGPVRRGLRAAGPMGSLPALRQCRASASAATASRSASSRRFRAARAHASSTSAPSPLDDTPVYTVPEGHYFFMGDNRDNSNDSRVMPPNGLGFVPFENLIGRADRVMFSSAGRSLFFFWTWRSRTGSSRPSTDEARGRACRLRAPASAMTSATPRSSSRR